MIRQRLSVVIITKNIADKLERTLQSVTWADEVIIVDGHSTDGTVEVARKYTDKIVDSEFEGFGRERMKGVEASTGDWILQLDGDEVVTIGFRQRLESLMAGRDDGCVSFKFRRKNIFFGRAMLYGGWYHYSAHLFKKGFARYEGDIHEKLISNGKHGKMEVGVEHYPFYSIDEFLVRQNRYTTLQSDEMYREDNNIPGKDIQRNLKEKPMKLFWKTYFKKQGFRDGIQGLVFSILFAFVHYLKWAKYWEKQQAVENSKQN